MPEILALKLLLSKQNIWKAQENLNVTVFKIIFSYEFKTKNKFIKASLLVFENVVLWLIYLYFPRYQV